MHVPEKELDWFCLIEAYVACPKRVVNEIVDLCTLMILCIALHRKRFSFFSFECINEKNDYTFKIQFD